MTNRKILRLISEYIKANDARQYDRALQIFEEIKREERRQEAKEEEEASDAA